MVAPRKMTATSTTRVELVTSGRVGQATLRSSPRTSEKNCVGEVRSRRRLHRRLPLGRARAVHAGLGHLALGLSVHDSSPRRGVEREQGRRDSNPQPPVLETGALPVELLPSGPGAGPEC